MHRSTGKRSIRPKSLTVSSLAPCTGRHVNSTGLRAWREQLSCGAPLDRSGLEFAHTQRDLHRLISSGTCARSAVSHTADWRAIHTFQRRLLSRRPFSDTRQGRRSLELHEFEFVRRRKKDLIQYLLSLTFGESN